MGIRLLLANWLLLAGISVGSAQEKAVDLEKAAQGNGYTHSPSRSRIEIPKEWQQLEARTVSRSSHVGLRMPHPEGQGQPGIEVTIFWSPLNVSFEEAVNLEHALLSMLYGQDKVGKLEPVKAGEKNGFKIHVAEGPTRNGKEAGVVFLFEAGGGDNHWKIKLRAVVQKMTQAENLKAVEGLLAGLKW